MNDSNYAIFIKNTMFASLMGNMNNFKIRKEIIGLTSNEVSLREIEPSVLLNFTQEKAELLRCGSLDNKKIGVSKLFKK